MTPVLLYLKPILTLALAYDFSGYLAIRVAHVARSQEVAQLMSEAGRFVVVASVAQAPYE